MNIFFTKIEHVHIYLLSTNIVYVVYELCICETIRIFSFFFANLAWFSYYLTISKKFSIFR